MPPAGAGWKNLGAKLRESREYLGLSQHDAAQHTGILRSALSDIERGERKVDSLELQRLSRLYRRPLSYFLGGDEAAEQTDTVHALARAVTDLTAKDQEEVLRFAEFLRHSAKSERREQ